MFKHGKNFNFFLILLCLLLVFLGKLDLIAIRNFKAFLSDFLAPITYAFNKPVKEIAGVFEEVKSTGFLRDENIRLKSEMRRLKVSHTKAASNELELLELRELLKSIPKNKHKIVTGRALTAPGGVFANTVLINAGKKNGIKIGQPAISSLGLVGYVVNVSLNSSRILLIIDINSMIPVYLTESNWPAVVQGQNGELLKIRFLSSEASLVEGESIETSGHGGRLPSGINIGNVVKSFSGKYYVKPTVDFHRITYISIITNFNLVKNYNKVFDGFAPLQKPKPGIGLKGINSSGNRKYEEVVD
ncbi:rod shape-determining protein MreC [Alphaproteobacteria bacterium]|nr:rod shape-determining protein MreC [Alphaproteobacteria bacterium]